MSDPEQNKGIVIRILRALTSIMPNQMTYGKRKKKSIIPFFQIYKDEKKSSPSSEERAKKRTSTTISISAFHRRSNNDSNYDIQSCLDDSIEEMASMLLDDTTMNELQGETGKRLSQTESAKILPQPPQVTSRHKALTELPHLLFQGDDDRAVASRPAIIAKGLAHEDYVTFSDEDGLDSCPPPVSMETSYAKKDAAPTLPRKSSKRKPRNSEKRESRDTRYNNRPQSEARRLTKTMLPSIESPFPVSLDETVVSTTVHQGVSKQIENMLAASRALKSQDDSLLSESSIASKKSVDNGNGVLSKMRNAINERLLDKHFKKPSQLPKNERLWDSSLHQQSNCGDEPSAMTAMELRMNEGSNLNNPKIQSLMGHSVIRRKPIADDGKSLKSRKSGDCVTLDDVSANAKHEAFTNFQRQKESILFKDQAAVSVRPMPNKSRAIEYTSDIRDEILQAASVRSIEPKYDMDFDTVFSSSPVAQSTPRIRLEPSFENDGSKRLKNVPAESRSLFDRNNPRNFEFSELNMATEHNQSDKTPCKKTLVKRNNSQVKDSGPAIRNHLSKRRKKHPSPSKHELEDLEDALKRYSPPVSTFNASTEDDLRVRFGELGSHGMLHSRDNNVLLRVPVKHGPKGSASRTKEKPEQSMENSSRIEPAKRPSHKFPRASMIPKLAGTATFGRRPEYLRNRFTSQQDASIFATDELQWDSTTYNVGMNCT